MDKKYKLTNEVNERGLYRIVALRDIPRYNVKKGDLGGFIQFWDNLSQEGDAWVDNTAQVYGKARVFENALVCNDAHIFDNAHVYGKAQVYGNAHVFDNAHVYGKAHVSGNALVYGNVHVYDNACTYDSAHVYGNAHIFDNAHVYGNAWLFGDAKVSSGEDYIVFKNWWSSERYFTWTRSNNMWKVGCFYGTGEELIAKAERDSELSGREYRRVVEYVESILKDENSTKKKVIHRDSKGRFCKSK